MNASCVVDAQLDNIDTTHCRVPLCVTVPPLPFPRMLDDGLLLVRKL